MRVLDLGNNESLVRGIFQNPDGTFTALTFSQGKDFKTLKGAIKWMAGKGFTPEGERIKETA